MKRIVQVCTLWALASFATGCASLQEIEQTPFAANFPPAPGRKYFLKKSPFRTTIVVCDGGPQDAVCFEKPN